VATSQLYPSRGSRWGPGEDFPPGYPAVGCNTYREEHKMGEGI